MYTYIYIFIYIYVYIYIYIYIYILYIAINIHEKVLNIRASYYYGKNTIQNNFTWYLKFHVGQPAMFQPVATIKKKTKKKQDNAILNIKPFA